jgi:hypothetical protein
MKRLLTGFIVALFVAALVPSVITTTAWAGRECYPMSKNADYET